jgi:hypothetical protein
MPSYVAIKVRRDAEANWSANNPILMLGEPGYETDTNKLKFGDGISTWNTLPYIIANIDAGILANSIADILNGGQFTSIIYDNLTDNITISVTGVQEAGSYAPLINGEIPTGILPVLSNNTGIFIKYDTLNNTYSFSTTGLAYDNHQHLVTDITDFNSGVSGLLSNINGLGYVNIITTGNLLGIEVTGLQPYGDYATIHSPSFSGIPLAPTASGGTNTDQIATTAFVRSEISNLVDSAPATLDTLNELALALGSDDSFSTTIINNLNNKASLSGSSFSGSIDGPSANFTSLYKNSVPVSISGHGHSVSDIIDFNSSVSGLIPSLTISAGSGISISSISGTYTISTTGNIGVGSGTSLPTVISIPYSSTLNTNATLGDIFNITLSGNATLANPSGAVDGQTLRWRILQDTSGNRVITLGNKFKLPNSASDPLPWSTSANLMDILAATYHLDRDKWDIVAFVPGY